MSLPAWSFTFDHAQQRFSRLRIGIPIAGPDLVSKIGDVIDDGLSQNVCIEPVTRSLILMPRAEESGWLSSNSGAYAKFGVTDFGSPAGIEAMEQQANRPMMHGDSNITLQTVSAFAKNTGVVLEILNYSNGQFGQGAELLRLGWSSTADVLTGVGVVIYCDHKVSVFKDGVKVQDGNLSVGGQSQNQTLRIYIMPHRRRELLMWTGNAWNSETPSGFQCIFPDIDESDTNPTITPAAKFWVKQPTTSTDILVAPLRFNTSGYACSEIYNMAEAPDGTDTRETFDNASWAGGSAQFYRVYGDQSYRTGNTDAASVSIVTTSGASFSPDGTTNTVRLKTSLSGDGNSSPAIYGVEVAYAGRYGTESMTDDSEQYDGTDAISEFSLDVPDGGGPTANLEVVYSEAIETNVAKILTQANRPFLIQQGSTHILNGRLSAPKYKRKSNVRAQKLKFVANSTILALKNYRFRDRKPLNGMLISHASNDCLVRFLLRQIGVADSAMQLETSTVRIGDVPPKVCGEWPEIIEVGATAWEILERFMDDYLGGWFYDAVPTSGGIKFKVCSPATLTGATSKATLYWTSEDAITAGVSEADAWKHVVREVDIEVVEAESNEVTVTGVDPRTGKAVQAVKRDYAAQDPTVAPSARVDNWAGEPRIAGVINGGISTAQLAEDASLVIAAKVFHERELLEIEAQYVLRNESTGLPLWRGDKVTVDGEDYIVQSLSMSAVSTATGFEWNPAKYVLSNVLGSTAGLNAKEIALRERQKRKDAITQRRNSYGVGTFLVKEIRIA